MRIVLHMEYTDRCGAFDMPEPGEETEDLVLDNIDEARKVWRVIVSDWREGKTGWFVSSIEIDEHYMDVDELFPDCDFDALVEDCLAN